MLCRCSLGGILSLHTVNKCHTRQDPVHLDEIIFVVGNYKRTSLSRDVVDDMPITRARVKTMGERRYKPQLPVNWLDVESHRAEKLCRLKTSGLE